MEIQRSFIVGDEWLYYKIYTGSNTADNILANKIVQLTESLMERSCIDRWFFIRYADPEYHLRLRFHLLKPEGIYMIVSQMNQLISPFVASGLVSSVKLDTYKRELERYGYLSMNESEELFWHDSSLVGKALYYLDKDRANDFRWLFGMRAIDKLLSDFKYSDMDKMKLLEGLKNNFGNEFNINKSLRKQLSRKFSFYRVQIGAALCSDYSGIVENRELFALIAKRTASSSCAINTILNFGRNLDVPINELLASHIHMHCNRLFKSKQRLHELVIYDLLYQHYKSTIARRKYSEA